MSWLLGPLIWIGHFLAVYSAQGLLCPAAARATLFVAVATVIALGALSVVLISQWKVRGNSFLQTIAVPLSALSLLAVAWVAAPALFIPAC